MTRAEPQAVPPKIKAGAPAAPLALFAGAVSAFVIGCGLAFIYFFNPSTHGFYPTCLFHQVTGWNCPGCGGTRAMYALLHGRFQTALHDNALFVVSLAGGAIWGAWLLLQKMKNPRVKPHWPANFAWWYLLVLVLFGVLRNLRLFSFLSP